MWPLNTETGLMWIGTECACANHAVDTAEVKRKKKKKTFQMDTLFGVGTDHFAIHQKNMFTLGKHERI